MVEISLEETIRVMIAQGWGVEDVALITGVPLEEVRLEVVTLRTEGELVKIYEAKS